MSTSSVTKSIANMPTSRGKKIFRRFDNADEDDVPSVGTEVSGTAEQRRLKHQAGPAAQRPLTRSAIKPRLLFRPEEQLLEREQSADDIDEEAVTDIEMPNASISPVKSTPAVNRCKPVSPPSTHHTKRGKKKAPASESPNAPTPIPGEDSELTSSAGVDDSFTSTASFVGKRKTRSPFDTWQRTKTGMKRAGDEAEEGASSGKRSRGAVLESPA